VFQEIREMTNGRGADVCVDAVGVETGRSFFDKVKAVVHFKKGTDNVLATCFKAVRRGVTVTLVGVYGSPYYNFPLHTLFDKELTVLFEQAPVQKYIDHLFKLVENKKVALNDIVTYVLSLSNAFRPYDIFKNKEED